LPLAQIGTPFLPSDVLFTSFFEASLFRVHGCTLLSFKVVDHRLQCKHPEHSFSFEPVPFSGSIRNFLFWEMMSEATRENSRPATPLRSFLFKSENQIKEINMRLPRIIPVFVCILFATSLAFAHKVRVDYDHSVNFAKYKTFMWTEKPLTENPLMDDRIVNAVNAQLSARGLELVATNADMSIKATQSIQAIPIFNTVYDGFGWSGPC